MLRVIGFNKGGEKRNTIRNEPHHLMEIKFFLFGSAKQNLQAWGFCHYPTNDIVPSLCFCLFSGLSLLCKSTSTYPNLCQRWKGRIKKIWLFHDKSFWTFQISKHNLVSSKMNSYFHGFVLRRERGSWTNVFDQQKKKHHLRRNVKNTSNSFHISAIKIFI